jgi:hypothetical protein
MLHNMKRRVTNPSCYLLTGCALVESRSVSRPSRLTLARFRYASRLNPHSLSRNLGYYVDKSNIEEWLLHQGLETEYGQIIDEVLRRKEAAKIKQNKFPSKQDEACEPDGIQVRQKPEMEHP